MFPDSDQKDAEQLLVQKCQQGDPDALAQVRANYQAALGNILLARGANWTEVEEVLADIWLECVPGNDDRPSLLQKFNGKCRLQNWLVRVAVNRWLDWKRRGKFTGEPPVTPDGGSRTEFFRQVPSAPADERDRTLTELLLASLRAGFAQCAPETLVLLRLVYKHGLTQREVMRMLGWSESKVSRALSDALEQIKLHTLTELKKLDPWLQLTWEDFQDLCETEQLGFL